MIHSKASFRNGFWCLIFLSIFVSAELDPGLGRGLGEEYEWYNLNHGLQVSKATNKPLMLIVHKSWCGACKAFKPRFAASKEVLSLSKKFVMVNVEDKEEPSDPKYSPDGGYIPRILFYDTKGNHIPQVYNGGGNFNYKHYYYEVNSVLSSMKLALQISGTNNYANDEL